MAWDKTAFADASTVAVEAPKVRANWEAIEDGNATGGVPQKGTWVESFYVGKTVDNDITIYANNADANKPYIRYDASENAWVISNDGSTESTLAVPQNAVILYVGASCPSGYSDITATYEDKAIIADSLGGASPSSGGGAATAGVTGGHSLTTAELAAHTHTLQGYGSGTGGATYVCNATAYSTANTGSTGSGTAHTHPLSYVGFRLCQKN
jgi:hypothetical protein